MKKLFAALILIMPTLAFSALIPISDFDQGKLEGIIRRTNSHVQDEERGEFLRKHYLLQLPGVEFKCSSDYHLSSPEPSYKRCEVHIDANLAKKSGDEWRVEINDSKMANVFFEALSFGVEEKKFYSSERVYGQSFEGEYRKLFRYSFACKKESCRLSFAKP